MQWVYELRGTYPQVRFAACSFPFSLFFPSRLLILLQYKKPEGAAKIETKASADVLATMAHAPRDFMKSNRSKIAQQSAANGVKEN